METNRVCFWTAVNEPESCGHSKWEEERISQSEGGRRSDTLILVPIEIPAISVATVELAIGIAQRANGRILLVHAIALNLVEFGPANPAQMKADERGEMEKELGEFVAFSGKVGVPAGYIIAEGSVPEVIGSIVREQHPALIILSSKGVRRLAKLVRRRTVKRVVQLVDCPVLVVHSNK